LTEGPSLVLGHSELALSRGRSEDGAAGTLSVTPSASGRD